MARKSRIIKAEKKKSSGIVKFLEAVVVLGSLAALAIKLFRGKKAK